MKFLFFPSMDLSMSDLYFSKYYIIYINIYVIYKNTLQFFVLIHENNSFKFIHLYMKTHIIHKFRI